MDKINYFKTCDGGAEIMVVLCYDVPVATFSHRREYEECGKPRTKVGGWMVVEISASPKCTSCVRIGTYQAYDRIESSQAYCS